MKILHCISSASIGGIERLVIELAEAQKKAGIDVAIMLDQKKGQYLKELEKQKISILESHLKSGFEYNLVKKKRLILTFNNFDIVHLHNFALLRSLSALKSTTKVIYTIHGLSKGIRKENMVKYLVRETLKNYYINQVDFIIANSKYTMDGAQKDYKLKPRAQTILNGSKRSITSISKPATNNDELIIGLVSRFTIRKRIDRLVQAFALFLKKGGRGRLILVGDGQAYESIQKLIEYMQLSDRVNLVGYSNEVATYYQQFDLCVFPAEQEPFGLAAVEAYYFGLPVLAFQDSGGLKEVIQPIEPDNLLANIEELANRLVIYQETKLYASEDEKKKRKLYALSNFSIERMEREYFKVYKSLIND